MNKARVSITRDHIIGDTDSRLFGAFVEHLGRSVYGGIYEPGHTTADEDGFRKDTLHTVQGMKIPVIRYPGGDFVSAYVWEDGVGSREHRPRKIDYAWKSIETNQFGTDEFMKWVKKVDSNPMLAVNLGTRSFKEACEYLQYCNLPGGTFYSDQRVANGHTDPYGVKLWCLGNEMDRKGQTGHKSADEYGLEALRAARAMKKIDSSVELVACGRTSTALPTFPEWDAKVLEHTYDSVDYLSMHLYTGNYNNDLNNYLARTVAMEWAIKSVISVCDYVKVKVKSSKQMNICFDEWGIWYHSHEKQKTVEPWQVAPPLLEEEYTAADAVVLGSMVITLLKYCDRIKIGCLAQLINVLAPIMTCTGGGLWLQTIYYPYYHALKYGQGKVLQCAVSSPQFTDREFGNVAAVDCIAVMEEKNITLFAVNKKEAVDTELDICMYGLEQYEFKEHIVLTADSHKVNTITNPSAVVPVVSYYHERENYVTKVKIPGLSWNVVRFTQRG